MSGEWSSGEWWSGEAMCDQWMPALKLPMTLEQFHQLPRNSAYKYEYIEGEAWLAPRATVYHARLDLASFAPDADEVLAQGTYLRRVRRRDLPLLARLFAAAFHQVQPFGSLDDATQLRAAEECLRKTTSGDDGPWVRPASFVATTNDEPIGAILITLMPETDPCDWDAYHWQEPAPSDLLRQRRGVPHVTWVFMSPWHKGIGIGSALLAASVNVLHKLGYPSLLSTFFTANESSMLWHWRNGFKLLPYPGSKRRPKKWFTSADLHA